MWKVTEKMKITALVDDFYNIRIALDRARKRMKQLKIPNGNARCSIGHLRRCVDIIQQGTTLLDQEVWYRIVDKRKS